MVNSLLGRVKCVVRNRIDRHRYPYLRITELPSQRPSVESIYYFINQLGKHQPIGLTHEVATGYHELPFPALRFKTSRRDLQGRLDRLAAIQGLKGSYGLDIGCALGGLTFGLQQMGAKMIGIDRDNPSITVAKECEALFKTGANFECASFSEEMLGYLAKSYGNPNTGKFDFAIWFSSFNWVAEALGMNKTRSLMRSLSEKADALIADSAIGGKGTNALSTIGVVSNETFVEFVMSSSTYTKVTQIGVDIDWYGRTVYRFFR